MKTLLNTAYKQCLLCNWKFDQWIVKKKKKKKVSIMKDIIQVYQSHFGVFWEFQLKDRLSNDLSFSLLT